MEKMMITFLKPNKEREVKSTLMYKGKIAAIKQYMEFAGCRLREAKLAVEKLGHDIEPGQAN